ncbi:hypothetical protein SARC_03737 [Sphaeroforma arctica JP610]|uniref:DUF4174 domain-containing protein n=1 Tax=Sphaeroforma arctica JP610 TaxID=667725 RepID=A0A0L0G5D2_9EUKA|nr:hypothetical protein SARC_03737 [Sphaeroforma arctica JP610]KNC84026.1 hypothetical protein SARC_03737 [Sphaeroforma arctica JP610]|eukprot:XP_014157928.1 hypothetical protein SARC_03737 [Sphaeroforma arctica JP610]
MLNTLCVIALALVAMPMAEAKKDINSRKWKNRLLVASVSDTESDLYETTKSFVEDNECDMADRSMKTIYFVDGQNNLYDTPGFVNGEGLWLVGFDGGKKKSSDDAELLDELFDLIDAMPMRKDQLRARDNKAVC